jgi:VWFA-related protein
MFAKTVSLSAPVSKLPGVLALASLLAYPIAAQTPMKEVIDVRVTNVEVIATDSKGNHIPGLTRDDFELYENGKLQPITNLFEANAGASKNTLPRRVVLYLDDSTLMPNNRKPLIPALKKLVADTMTAGDQMMIVTFNQSSKTRLPWTNDPAAVQAALDTVGQEPGGGRTRQAVRSRVEDDIRKVVAEDLVGSQSANAPPPPDFRVLLSSVRNYATSVTHDFGLSAASLESLFGSLAGVDGRKIVIIASESFSTRPGSDVFGYLENVRNQILSGSGSAGLQRSARNTSVNAEASEFNTNETIVMLGRIANAAGVTVYALDPDTGGGPGSGNVEQAAPDQMSGMPAGTSAVDGLQILAQATGGVAWVGARPAIAFEKIRADLEHYYSIGYQAQTGGAAERSIEVKPKRADLRVRAQKSIVFRSAESEMPGRVTSNLQSPQMNDLGITLQVAGDVVTDGDTRRVPIHVLIPASNLTILPEGDVVTGGFSVFVCTAGGKAAPSGVHRQTHEIRWPPGALAQLKDRKMTFALDVVLEKGRDQISVGVLDHRSQATVFSKIAM